MGRVRTSTMDSFHKYLQIRDLCKEPAFGINRVAGRSRDPYSSFAFNVYTWIHVVVREAQPRAYALRQAGYLQSLL
jgi:hypothetical protein